MRPPGPGGTWIEIRWLAAPVFSITAGSVGPALPGEGIANESPASTTARNVEIRQRLPRPILCSSGCASENGLIDVSCFVAVEMVGPRMRSMASSGTGQGGRGLKFAGSGTRCRGLTAPCVQTLVHAIQPSRPDGSHFSTLPQVASSRRSRAACVVKLDLM